MLKVLHKTTPFTTMPLPFDKVSIKGEKRNKVPFGGLSKKRITGILLFLITVLFQSCTQGSSEKTVKIPEKDSIISAVFKIADKQFRLLIDSAESHDPLWMPRTLRSDGSIVFVPKEDWTSGFFPGSLWYMYEYTGDGFWKKKAEKFTEALDSIQYIKWNHDVGFMVGDSYGNGYRLTKKPGYKDVIIEAAKSLSTRYRPVAKVIQSWDTNAGWIAEKGWDMPVIIDNMMNLDLLFKAAELSGDSGFINIAVNHSYTTIKNHFRPDYSSYHVIDYDHKTGEVLHKNTGQGYADESAWARGQAWGLYGFTETYGNSQNKDFLEQAKHIADFIINNPKIPDDNIPYWDYDAPDIPNAPRDASAAAITASALLELQKYVPEKRDVYIKYAEKILKTLSTHEYLARPGENGGFLLTRSVGNIHTGEDVNNALNYADYYFLEAMIRLKNLK
jgi:rhamnogalacturonyl hydrolase YesR